jgi:hypothetical protein
VIERTNGRRGAGYGPPPGASIEVTLRSGDTPVRQFVRVCPEDADQIRRIAEHAIGWLQVWSAQLSDEQWAMDIRAQERQAS